MKIFACGNCGGSTYFDNRFCVRCNARLGFLPERLDMVALPADDTGPYRYCVNAAHDACNWLVPAQEGHALCRACRYNRTIPDLSVAENLENWRRIEAAKRHLFYSLLCWNLPAPDRAEDPDEGLVFDFLTDVENPDGTVEAVLTGHNAGLITLNIAEGDDAERERRRTEMGEPYRTLLGHFRHEIGHYYWDRLVRDGGHLDRFRALFGDERQDYGEALKAHYANGPAEGWQSSFISSYAAAHPWEDFAESWAHYMHIVDTLETAEAFGMRVRHPDGNEAGRVFQPYHVADVRMLLDAWTPLTIAINAVNRSMGQPDLYPFVLSQPVTEKLQFIAGLVMAANGRVGRP